MPYRGELQNSVLSVLDDYRKRKSKESRDLFIGLKKEEEGSLARPWMDGRSFEDLDGHIWEVFFRDES